MKCGQCPTGKRYARGSTYCTLYGMIVSDGYEGDKKGCAAVEGQREEKQPGETADMYGLEWPEYEKDADSGNCQREKKGGFLL